MKGEGLSGRPFFSQALRLRNFRPSAAIAAWKPPESGGGGTGGGKTDVVYRGKLGGGNAVGGFIHSDGLAYVHAGNMITPARQTRGVKGFSELMTLARNTNRPNGESLPNHLIDAPTNVGGQTAATTVHYSPTVNINGAKPGAEKRFREELNEHTAHITRIFTREIDRSRARG